MPAIIDYTRYSTIAVRNKDGKVVRVRNNGDAVSRALILFIHINGKTIEQVIRANKLVINEQKNQGQLRMAVGNALRKLVRAGNSVIVGDVTIKNVDQKVALPEVTTSNGKTKPVKSAPKKVAKAKAKVTAPVPAKRRGRPAKAQPEAV